LMVMVCASSGTTRLPMNASAIVILLVRFTISSF
jgi:hypothetical protein